MRSTVLVARSLQKASVPPALLSDPTPGSLQPTRLAAHVNGAGSSCSVYLASGCRVYRIEIRLDASVMLSKGKESLLIPDNAQVISSSVVDRCPHRSEIQSVALAEGEDDCLILGTVDSYGHLIVSRLDIVADDIDRTSYSVPPRDCGVGEGSWAGVCFSPMQQSMVAVARQLCKTIDIYDQDIHVRSLRTLWYPSSFSFVQYSPHVNESSSLLATAEGSQLSIWDLRMNNNGGCVHRITGSVGDIIYSTCSSPSGLIASGGTDRAVTIYDPRRWSALSRWVGCSKFEVLRFHQLTNLSSTSKVLIMRLPVDIGNKVSEHSHFEGIPTGWGFQSVPTMM
uniref:Transducin/WD40 repeat-like superfamily protein n=2 Tax=Zea mays TaxID=4577 RepID=A0A804NAC6_MAIZE